MGLGRLILKASSLLLIVLDVVFAQSQDPKPLTPAELRHATMYSQQHCGQMIPLLLSMSKRFSGTAQGKAMLDTHNFYVAQCKRAEDLRTQDKTYKNWLAQRRSTPTPTPTPAPTPTPDNSTQLFGKLDPNGPNDQHYSLQNSAGLKEVSMMKAWGLNRDCGKIEFSVFDTGIDFNHPEIKDSYRAQSSYDFVTNQPNAIDKHWHGTFVAGIIGSQSNNKNGIAGACWRSNLASKAVLNSQGIGTLSDIIRAMNATSNATPSNASVSVWNLSISIMNQVVFELSNTQFPQTMTQAITNAGTRNIVVVIAAGNSNQPLGTTAMLPRLPKNLLVVGATDASNKLANFTNYSGVVQVYAPGVNIPSTVSGSSYAVASGTSFSAPLVAGIAGLYSTQYPQLKANQIVENIIKTSRVISNSKNGLPLSTPVVDAGKLLETKP